MKWILVLWLYSGTTHFEDVDSVVECNFRIQEIGQSKGKVYMSGCFTEDQFNAMFRKA